MSHLDDLIKHAKERVETTQVPPSLYSRAEFRKNIIDSLITLAIASLIVSLTTIQSSKKVTLDSPAVRNYVAKELVTTGVQQ